MHDWSLLEIQIIERIHYFRLNFESCVIFAAMWGLSFSVLWLKISGSIDTKVGSVSLNKN